MSLKQPEIYQQGSIVNRAMRNTVVSPNSMYSYLWDLDEYTIYNPLTSYFDGGPKISFMVEFRKPNNEKITSQRSLAQKARSCSSVGDLKIYEFAGQESLGFHFYPYDLKYEAEIKSLNKFLKLYGLYIESISFNVARVCELGLVEFIDEYAKIFMDPSELNDGSV